MSIFKSDNNNVRISESQKQILFDEYENKRTTEILKRFYEDLEKNQRMIKPFSEIVREIIGDDNYMTFQYKTGLSTNMYYSLLNRTNRKSQTKKSTIVSLCIGYNVGIQVALELMHSQGSCLNPHSDIDCAYTMLLTECRGKSVEECDRILEQLNIGVTADYRLGVHTTRPRKRRKAHQK